MRRWINWFGLLSSVVFCSYFIMAIPSSVSKRLDRADLLAVIDGERDLEKLRAFAAAKVALLCNYNFISGRLLIVATSFGLANLALFLVNVMTRDLPQGDEDT
jgi:hypothetical protein